MKEYLENWLDISDVDFKLGDKFYDKELNLNIKYVVDYFFDIDRKNLIDNRKRKIKQILEKLV